MQVRSTWLVPALFVMAAAPARGQQVGSYLPALELDDFAQTKARSLDDYFGRTVLIEFFAHW